MYDYTLNLQTQHKIADIRRANERRHWLRDILNGQREERNENASRKAQINRGHTSHD